MSECMLLESSERWKAVVGFPSYAVSTLGQVLSYQRSRVTLLSPKIGKQGKGYFDVGIRKADGTRKYLRISRMVAEAFVPNPENKPQVNHKDGNKLNNIWTNLEWATGKENVQHAHDTGLCSPSNGETHYRAKLSDLQVAEIRKKYICPCVEKFGRKRKNCTHGNTVTLLAIEYGVCFQEIHYLVSGRIRKHVDKQAQLPKAA